jgi:hypothetical protein
MNQLVDPRPLEPACDEHLPVDRVEWEVRKTVWSRRTCTTVVEHGSGTADQLGHAITALYNGNTPECVININASEVDPNNAKMPYPKSFDNQLAWVVDPVLGEKEHGEGLFDLIVWVEFNTERQLRFSVELSTINPTP